MHVIFIIDIFTYHYSGLFSLNTKCRRLTLLVMAAVAAVNQKVT